MTLPSQTSPLDDYRRAPGGGPLYQPNDEIRLSVTPLVLAAVEGRDDVISILLEFSDIDKKPEESDVTALFMALFLWHAKTAALLLNQGDQPGACSRYLYAAARSGLDNIITLLVTEFKANPNRPDNDGATPVIYALQLPEDRARTTIMRLRELGALGGLELASGWTFKQIACAMGKKSFASIFKALAFGFRSSLSSTEIHK